ncbi:hypothetical protein [Pusillimonas sp.]|uniref:hypothetical protein n=1 Tax=Pusillimonas sp. TaxID=3040095 RepID=UPI0037C840F3
MTFKKGDRVRAKKNRAMSDVSMIFDVDPNKVYVVTDVELTSIGLEGEGRRFCTDRFELVEPAASESVIGYKYQYLSQLTGEWRLDPGLYSTEEEARKDMLNSYGDNYKFRIVRLVLTPQVFESQPRTLKAI